jgi:two-component system cell cycle response regulator
MPVAEPDAGPVEQPAVAGWVLLVDPSPTQRAVCSEQLEAVGFRVRGAADGVSALAALDDGPTDIVVSAVDMHPMHGYALVRALRTRPETADLPFLFLSTHPPDVVRAGAGGLWVDDVVPKHARGALSAAVRAALARRVGRDGERWPPRVLVADDSATARAVLRDVLEGEGYVVLEAPDGPTAIIAALTFAPDAILLDLQMPGRHGLEVLADLRSDPHTADVPVVVGGDARSQTLAGALASGAHDYLRKPVDPVELTARLRTALRVRELQDELRCRNLELETTASVDQLTGLLTRGRGERLLQRFAAEATGTGEFLGLVLADIDHFKAVNDTHGHAVGDAVLAQVATLVLDGTRAGDVVVRWGGEEFLVLVRRGSIAGTAAAAERARRSVAMTPVELAAGAALAVTISLGVAALEPGEDALTALARADAALYEAKASGRNRVCGGELVRA